MVSLVQCFWCALLKVPNRVCVSLPLHEDKNRLSFSHMFYSLEVQMMENVHKHSDSEGRIYVRNVEVIHHKYCSTVKP
jgi:hypothetical protein